MNSISVARTLTLWRLQVGRAPGEVAHAAGISEERYRMLETGIGWPGGAALEAVLDVLGLSPEERGPYAFAGTPLSQFDRNVMLPDAIPAVVVDHTWRMLEANAAFVDLLPSCGQVGANLLSSVLVPARACDRVANWEQVASSFAAALRDSLIADPDNTELRALRDCVPDGLWERAGHLRAGQPDGQVLVVRVEGGLCQSWTCLAATPSHRPDLIQLMLTPAP